MELYRKYRPKEFKEIVGNKDAVNNITAKIEKGNLPHALLFTGQSGTGKTTIGRIIANSIDATKNDYNEIDTADFRGIDTVREVRRNMHNSPWNGKNKVYLLDEVHQLGQGGNSNKNTAQNALLKGLEKPPDHCYFILCTTEPQMLLTTIKSRCTIFEMEVLSVLQIQKLLMRIVKKENVKINKDILLKIAEASNGRARKSLTILEKVIHSPEDQIEQQIQKEKEKESNAFMLAQVLFKNEPWKKAAKLLKDLENENTEMIRRVIFKYMMTVTSKQANEHAGNIMFAFQDPLYEDYERLWFICHQLINGFEL